MDQDMFDQVIEWCDEMEMEKVFPIQVTQIVREVAGELLGEDPHGYSALYANLETWVLELTGQPTRMDWLMEVNIFLNDKV